VRLFGAILPGAASLDAREIIEDCAVAVFADVAFAIGRFA
jgi:hypothetical protein